jgi:hypothetical protein
MSWTFAFGQIKDKFCWLEYFFIKIVVWIYLSKLQTQMNQ